VVVVVVRKETHRGCGVLCVRIAAALLEDATLATMASDRQVDAASFPVEVVVAVGQTWAAAVVVWASRQG
jgi:hypothetical protein